MGHPRNDIFRIIYFDRNGGISTVIASSQELLAMTKRKEHLDLKAFSPHA
jgi:hypothetical protein